MQYHQIDKSNLEKTRVTRDRVLRVLSNNYHNPEELLTDNELWANKSGKQIIETPFLIFEISADNTATG